MAKPRLAFTLVGIACLIAGNASAANVTVSRQAFHPNQAMVNASNGGLTLQSQIFMYFLTSDADVLSINQVQVQLFNGATLFQVPPPFGSNTSRPDPAFIAINPALQADSWIDTPGATSLLGTDLPGDGTGSYGDLTNNGPQTNFKFAQLTIPELPASGRFNFRISVAGQNGPEVFSFLEFPEDPPLLPYPTLPEPGAVSLISIGFVALAGFRRRTW